MSEAVTKKSDILQLVSFNLGNEEYAVDILKVQEIHSMVEITTIPNTPFDIEGVINLRGKVIPVINLRKKFGFDLKELDAHSRIIVVDVGATVGLIVDSVSEVLRLPSETVEPQPRMTGNGSAEYISGIGKLQDKLLVLLDLDSLLKEEAGQKLLVENTQSKN